MELGQFINRDVVGTLVSPIEGLKLFLVVVLLASFLVGTLVSPIEGLKLLSTVFIKLPADWSERL